MFVWDTPAGLQYRSRPDQPLIDENELAGLAPPRWRGTDSPDTGWDTPSALGADPDLLSIDDVLDAGGIGQTDAAPVAVRSGVL